MSTKKMTGSERKQQIVERAGELFSAQGFANTTTKQIARHAGINEAVIYQHFSSKDELFDATIDHYINKVQVVIENAEIDHELNIKDALTAIMSQALSFAKNNQAIPRMMLYSALQDHRFTAKFFASISFPVFSLFTQKIAEESERGNIKDGIRTTETAFAILASFIMYNIGKNIVKAPMLQAVDDEKYVENTINVLLNGILKNPSVR